MTQQQAARWAKEIQALGEGKVIEQCWTYPSTDWERTTEPSFSVAPSYRCRIVEPKLRPWRPEEVPPVCWVRVKGGTKCWLVVSVDLDGLELFNNFVDYLTLSREYKLLDGSPCGVEEVS